MVQFQFQFGRRRKGGWGVATVPTYSFVDWRRTHADDDRMAYRPSWRTVLRRSQLTVAAAIILGLLGWSIGFPWQPDQPRIPAPANARHDPAVDDLVEEFQRRVPPERRKQFAENLERNQRRHEQRVAAQVERLAFLKRIGHAVYWAAFLAIAAAGLLPLIFAAWERVEIERGFHDELIVRRRLLFTRTRAWPAGSFGSILCHAAERIHRRRRQWTFSLGWFWVVRLMPQQTGTTRSGTPFVDDPIVEFHVGHQHDRPLDAHRPPRRVRSFLKRLGRLVGTQNVQFALIPDPFQQKRGRGWWPMRRQTVTYMSEPVVHSVKYGSLDELPDELQDDVCRILAEGVPPEGVVHKSVRFTVRDADGNERVYTSLDELPPELRKQYERAQRSLRRKRRR